MLSSVSMFVCALVLEVFGDFDGTLTMKSLFSGEELSLEK